MAVKLTRREQRMADRLDKGGLLPGDWYDRDGEPITLGQWGVLRTRRDYMRVAMTSVNDMWISTVWIGLAMLSWGDGPPLIFETLIFDEAGDPTRAMWRYATEEQALEGHQRAVDLAFEVGSAEYLENYPL